MCVSIPEFLMTWVNWNWATLSYPQQISYYGELSVRLQMECMIIKSKDAKYL